MSAQTDKFFDILKSWGHCVNAYVIKPDHVHAILSFTYTEKSINRILGDGKRFITYDFIEQLKTSNSVELLERLAGFVNDTDRKKGKLHEAFEPSFEWKECYSDNFIEQKLNYIYICVLAYIIRRWQKFRLIICIAQPISSWVEAQLFIL